MNNTEIGIILPDCKEKPADFYASGKKYPVLWLLHGTFGDYSDWIRKSNIELYACEREVIVVMPSAMNSDYVNWPDFGTGYNMWDCLTDELMPMVYNWLPASAKPEDNFIAGLSMGGEGAIKYAVGHPDKFAGCAVLSAAPVEYRRYLAAGEGPFGGDRWEHQLRNAGGAEGLLASPNHVWEKLPGMIDTLPKLYCACGKDDFLYPIYTDFKAYAEKIGLHATFEEFDGFKHEWRFWDMTIERALNCFGLKPVADQ
jgi:putative tributyrin esterase